tara:strand:- start:685 stop:957 length:273 start_codon:yes stop_codon:yes gene_type:complete
MDPKFGKKITCECGKKWYTLKKTNRKCSCGKILVDQSIETAPVIQQAKPQSKEPMKKEEDIAKIDEVENSEDNIISLDEQVEIENEDEIN